MTTGRINQIANVTSPTQQTGEAGSRAAGREGRQVKNSALQRVLYYSRLKSLAGRPRTTGRRKPWSDRTPGLKAPEDDRTRPGCVPFAYPQALNNTDRKLT